MKKFMVSLGAIALAGSLVIVPTFSANAEELPEAVSVEAVVEEATTTEVVEEVEPIVEEKTEGVEEEVVEAAIVAAPAASESKRTAEISASKTLRWLTPYVGDTAPSSSNPDIWNQTLYTTDVCGTGWIQIDEVKYNTPEEIAIVDGLVAQGTLSLINGVPEDSKVYISHYFEQQTACVEPPALCELEGTTGNINAAGDDIWWEIHFGQNAETQNEPATFNAESYGGWAESAQVGYDDKPAKHMAEGNIYVHMPSNAGQSETWHFWDGTKITFTVGEDICNPTMTWLIEPPRVPFPNNPEEPVDVPDVVEEPETETPAVEEEAVIEEAAVATELPETLAYTGVDHSNALLLGGGFSVVGMALVIMRRRFGF